MAEVPKIDEELCIGCWACVAICGQDVFGCGENEKVLIVNGEGCKKAGDCAKICPTEAITLPWQEDK